MFGQRLNISDGNELIGVEEIFDFELLGPIIRSLFYKTDFSKISYKNNKSGAVDSALSGAVDSALIVDGGWVLSTSRYCLALDFGVSLNTH